MKQVIWIQNMGTDSSWFDFPLPFIDFNGQSMAKKTWEVRRLCLRCVRIRKGNSVCFWPGESERSSLGYLNSHLYSSAQEWGAKPGNKLISSALYSASCPAHKTYPLSVPHFSWYINNICSSQAYYGDVLWGDFAQTHSYAILGSRRPGAEGQEIKEKLWSLLPIQQTSDVRS